MVAIFMKRVERLDYRLLVAMPPSCHHSYVRMGSHKVTDIDTERLGSCFIS